MMFKSIRVLDVGHSRLIVLFHTTGGCDILRIMKHPQHCALEVFVPQDTELLEALGGGLPMTCQIDREFKLLGLWLWLRMVENENGKPLACKG